MKKCRDVMSGDPVCCVPTDTAARVAKLMKMENIGSVPICEDRHGKKLMDIVTDRDLALQVVAERPGCQQHKGSRSDDAAALHVSRRR